MRVCGVNGEEVLREERMAEESGVEEVCEWKTSCIRCAVEV